MSNLTATRNPEFKWSPEIKVRREKHFWDTWGRQSCYKRFSKQEKIVNQVVNYKLKSKTIVLSVNLFYLVFFSNLTNFLSLMVFETSVVCFEFATHNIDTSLRPRKFYL